MMEEGSLMWRVGMKRVGIIGNFGGNEIGGQITKTQELYEAMKLQFKIVYKLDVFKIKKNYFKLGVQLYRVLKNANEVVIILASPGYFNIIPVILAINILFHR